MDKKTSRLLIFLLALIVISTSASFYRFIILKDYITSAETECDPETESCFVWICDPEVDGEDYCTGDLEEDTWYYKIVDRNSKNIPLCDPNAEGCEALVCQDNEYDCYETLCTAELLKEYEIEHECTDPLTFEW